jgi:hypothetical protein
MDAEAVLKHRVRNEQTSREKKSPSKGVLIFYFFPAHMQIFRPIGQSFGSRRERVNPILHTAWLDNNALTLNIMQQNTILVKNPVFKIFL